MASACSAGSKAPHPSISGLQVFKEDPKPRHTTKHVTYDHTPPAGGQHDVGKTAQGDRHQELEILGMRPA